MKLKLYQLNGAMAAEPQQLSVLGKFLKQDLPIKDAWNTGLLVKKLTPEFENFLERKNALITKYGTLIEGSKSQYNFEGENADLFTKEINELLNTEIEVDIIKIKISSLEGKNINMSSGEMIILDFLFE